MYPYPLAKRKASTGPQIYTYGNKLLPPPCQILATSATPPPPINFAEFGVPGSNLHKIHNFICGEPMAKSVECHYNDNE